MTKLVNAHKALNTWGSECSVSAIIITVVVLIIIIIITTD